MLNKSSCSFLLIIHQLSIVLVISDCDNGLTSCCDLNGLPGAQGVKREHDGHEAIEADADEYVCAQVDTENVEKATRPAQPIPAVPRFRSRMDYLLRQRDYCRQ